jgi:hypothetical protein
MKTRLLFTAAMAVLLAACQKPTEVQVTEEALLDVENVTEPDPAIDRASVDSTALLPREQDRFAGFITVASVKSDNGAGIESKSFVHAAFENRNNSITVGGLKRFFLFPLGLPRVTIGGNTVFLVMREVRFGNQLLGVEYVREIPYAPEANYRFEAVGSDSVNAFSVSIDSPDNIFVQSPVGGQRIARDNDINLRWTGRGNPFLIISARTGQGKLIPVLNIKPRRNEGRALLTKKILNALPRGSYVFTFCLSNRNENFMVGRFRGRVLVRGLSIYNIRVELI